jgi:hypothetical protein
MTDKHQRSLLDVQPELQEAVVRLLLSLDEANLKIAVSLLNGEPSPPPVRAAFLVVAHLKRLAPRQQLLFKHQLRAHLPDALRPDYDRLFHLDHPSDPYPGPNGLHIGSLIRLLKADPELDGLEVARIMFQGGDARLRGLCPALLAPQPGRAKALLPACSPSASGPQLRQKKSLKSGIIPGLMKPLINS